MSIANPITYLTPLLDELEKKFPENRTINLVCHGHSVPTGYFATPWINTFDAYPHLLHRLVKERFPFAAVNVITTSIGGEESASGAKRFAEDVLPHKPDLVTIDYGLNDRRLSLEETEKAWRSMIEACQEKGIPVILLTPTWDNSYYNRTEEWQKLCDRAALIRRLAEEYSVGLADSFAAFEAYVQRDEMLTDLLSHGNHPTRRGHELVARELGRFFPAR